MNSVRQGIPMAGDERTVGAVEGKIKVGADPVTLRIMLDNFRAIPEEMGRALRRTAHSPNIKERMDASCAIFDPMGRLLAQAEHIPVHLGSMPLVMEMLLPALGDMKKDDQLLLNDPFYGGTHLPDLTVIKPVFSGDEIAAFVVNRAHHADVGGMSPGSMPATSRDLFQEGIIIPPVRAVAGGEENLEVINLFLNNTRSPGERMGDLRAQFSANNLGEKRFVDLLGRYGPEAIREYCEEVMDYSRRRMRMVFEKIVDGRYVAEGTLELDTFDAAGGWQESAALIRVEVRVKGGTISVDFRGTDPELEGNLNAPRGVTLSAVYYVFRCLTDPGIPHNDGCFRDIEVNIPEGCLLSPSRTAAVCGGNVETSQTIVDILLRALRGAFPGRIPAGSQGTMNNLTIGGHGFCYYETLGGGAGAMPAVRAAAVSPDPCGDPGTPRTHGMVCNRGADGVHTHMTNTANTPVEALELAYPLRVLEYSLVDGSGGSGCCMGGMGLRRKIELLAGDGHLSILSGGRWNPPGGVAGGGDGRPGKNILVRGGEEILLPSLVDVELKKGDIVVIETPGGGGYGRES